MGASKPSSSTSTSSSSSSRRWLLAFLVPVLLATSFYALSQRPAVFEHEVLQRIAREARVKFPPTTPTNAATLNQTAEFIMYELHKAYPKHIHPNKQWVTNLAGGFKTGMLILHASLTEYVMIWGAQLDTTGHSGRNMAQFNDYIIAGEGRWWKEGGLEVQVASPLSQSYVHTPYFQGGVVQLTAGTWMLEHCHGVIPALLPFGLGDAIFSSMDPVTIYRSLTAYGGLTLKELFQNGKI